MSVDERNNQKLLMGIIGGLIVVVAAICGYFWLTQSQPNQQHVDELAVAPVTTQQAQQDSTLQSAAEPVPASTQSKGLVDDSLLKADVPQNPSLAQEELAKLDDIQTQLNDQKQLLDAQHADADALIKLKEEQIKLLEAQLAQKN